MPSLGTNPLDYVSTDRRVVQAAVLVAVVSTAGRLFTDSNTLLLTAGLLAGVVNAPRTDNWEFGTKFGALPAVVGGVVMVVVMTAGVPLGYYSFPFESPLYQSTFDLVGPVFEFHLFLVLYPVEGWLGFKLTRLVPGVGAAQSV